MAFRRVSSSLLSRRLLLSSATRPNPTPVDLQVWQPSPTSPASPHISSQASPHTSFPTTHPSTAHSRAPKSARARARAPNASPNTHTLLASRAQSRAYARVTPQTPRDSPPGASPGSVVRPTSTSWRQQKRPRHHASVCAARNESTSNARHAALDRALDGEHDTERVVSVVLRARLVCVRPPRARMAPNDAARHASSAVALTPLDQSSCEKRATWHVAIHNHHNAYICTDDMWCACACIGITGHSVPSVTMQ